MDSVAELGDGTALISIIMTLGLGSLLLGLSFCSSRSSSTEARAPLSPSSSTSSSSQVSSPSPPSTATTTSSTTRGFSPKQPAALSRVPPDDPVAFEAALLDPGAYVALAIAAVVSRKQAEGIAKALVAVFESRGRHVTLLRRAIKEEVATTASEMDGTLFRANSMVNRMLVAYAKAVGSKYLVDTLEPPIRALLSETGALEVDAGRVNGEIAQVGLNNMKRHIARFVDALTASAAACPFSMREMAKVLADVTESKFPGRQQTAVSGFMVLRYFGPAMVSPDAFGIVSAPPSREHSRALIVISKVLQKMANGTSFGTKDAGMAALNPLVAEYTPRLTAWFAELIDLTHAPDTSEHVVVTSDQARTVALEELHGFVLAHRDRIANFLVSPLRKRTLSVSGSSRPPLPPALALEAARLMEEGEGAGGETGETGDGDGDGAPPVPPPPPSGDGGDGGDDGDPDGRMVSAEARNAWADLAAALGDRGDGGKGHKTSHRNSRKGYEALA